MTEPEAAAPRWHFMTPEMTAEYERWNAAGRVTGRPVGLSGNEMMRFREYMLMVWLDRCATAPLAASLSLRDLLGPPYSERVPQECWFFGITHRIGTPPEVADFLRAGGAQ